MKAPYADWGDDDVAACSMTMVRVLVEVRPVFRIGKNRPESGALVVAPPLAVTGDSHRRLRGHRALGVAGGEGVRGCL
jgi:hypothetical protein